MHYTFKFFKVLVECDCRLLPGAGPRELEAELRLALGDDLPYELELPGEAVGGSVSPLDTPLTDVCRRFVERHDPGALLLPTISTGFCDAHYLRESFGAIAYGFWPLRRTPTDVYLGGIHNRDERIHVDDLVHATRFHLEAARAIGGLGR